MQQPSAGWKQAFRAELARYLRTVAVTFPLYFIALALVTAGIAWLGRSGADPSESGWNSTLPGMACKALFFACAFATSVDKPFRFVVKLIVLVALGGAVGVYSLMTESLNPWWEATGLIGIVVAVEAGLVWRWAVNWKANAVPGSALPKPHESHGMTPAGD